MVALWTPKHLRGRQKVKPFKKKYIYIYPHFFPALYRLYENSDTSTFDEHILVFEQMAQTVPPKRRQTEAQIAVGTSGVFFHTRMSCSRRET